MDVEKNKFGFLKMGGKEITWSCKTTKELDFLLELTGKVLIKKKKIEESKRIANHVSRRALTEYALKSLVDAYFEDVQEMFPENFEEIEIKKENKQKIGENKQKIEEALKNPKLEENING